MKWEIPEKVKSLAKTMLSLTARRLIGKGQEYDSEQEFWDVAGVNPKKAIQNLPDTDDLFMLPQEWRIIVCDMLQSAAEQTATSNTAGSTIDAAGLITVSPYYSAPLGGAGFSDIVGFTGAATSTRSRRRPRSMFQMRGGCPTVRYTPVVGTQV